ncbi:GMC family oxidoreductase [Glutamicibacter creatinolyticus]|uniref:GMC family oxidoreductase n=1 Tax=Glutamicibacter creatinolyticus TaxID=162496 RepID=UPI003216B786
MSTWKYVVVGGGSAGATFAARRAAAGDKVLLLESGPDYRAEELHEAWRSPNPLKALVDPIACEGMMYPKLLAKRTPKQEPAPYWRGRGVGGSSAINGQIAIRPPAEDFDNWAADGCDGWSWSEVLPYFRKLEHDAQFGEESHHGNAGPIPIYRAGEETWGPADRALADAAQEMGLQWVEDINSPSGSGVSVYPINSRNLRRVSVNDAYIEPQRENPNLTVRGGSTVDRVLFRANRAIGVRIITDEGAVEEYGEEIILAAGAVHTPPILIRSGIGPAAVLERLSVPVRRELPVGEGLQDHPMIAVGILLGRNTPPVTVEDRHTNIAARFNSDDPDGCRNDLMLVSMNQNVLAMESADTSHGAAAIGIWLNQVHSRGRVEVTSVDPLEQPFVDERMLTDVRDIRRLRQGAQFLARLCTTAPVRAISAVPVEQSAEEFYTAIASNDERRIDEFLRSRVADTQHATSTCRMGREEDPRSVVNPECKVIGFEGLRVIDASIFPSVPRANTHLATVAIAEAMADRVIPKEESTSKGLENAEA